MVLKINTFGITLKCFLVIITLFNFTNCRVIREQLTNNKFVDSSNQKNNLQGQYDEYPVSFIFIVSYINILYF